MKNFWLEMQLHFGVIFFDKANKNWHFTLPSIKRDEQVAEKTLEFDISVQNGLVIVRFVLVSSISLNRSS